MTGFLIHPPADRYDYATCARSAAAIGAARQHRHRNDPDRLVRTPHIDQEAIGVIGECFFAQYLGLPVDPIYRARGGPADFVVEGFTFDVKTAQTYPGGGRLHMIALVAEAPADFYAFMLNPRGEPVAYPAGWCDRRHLEREAAIKPGTFSGVLCYWLPQDRLWPMETLAPHLEARHAEEYRLVHELVEHRTVNGRDVTVRWWLDKRSAAIEIDGHTAGYVYTTTGQWHDLADVTRSPYPSYRAAVEAVIDRHTGV